MWSPYGARDANFHCAFFVLKSVMLTSGVDLWTCRSLVLCYHVCGCLEHVKLVQRLMPTLLRLVFEERDANFRSGPMDLSFTVSLLPRLWLFGTCEACSALDANSVALGF